VNPDDPLEQLKALKAGVDPLEELKKRRATSIISPPLAAADAAKDAAAVVQAPSEGKSGDFERARDMGLGLAASAPQAIPGAEAVQAGARSLFRRQPFSEALSDMRASTDPIPVPLKIAVQLPALLATAKLPISPAKAGALLGGASQALSPDSQSASERALRTTLGTAGGAAVGKFLDSGQNLLRAKLPGRVTAGELTQQLEGQMRAADRVNFGPATREAAASSQRIAGVRKILNSPTVKAFTNDVRSSPQFAKADDASVLAEVYSSMGAAERSLKQSLRKEFNPDSQRLLTDIVRAKQDLLREADKVMPSFRPAVQAHAIAESKIDAVGTGVSAAKRVFGATPGGKQLRSQSVERFADILRKMTPEDRSVAVAGAMSETDRQTGFQPNAVSLGGLLTSIARPGKMSSFLRSAGDPRQSIADLLNRLVLSEGANASR
jgi:hypothetical protein